MFVIYVNDLPDRLSAGSLLYADDVKLIAALNPNSFLPLYKTFIRPHFEYAIQATHLILRRDAKALEKVQKLVLKFVKGLRHVPHEAALKQLHLFSLTHRRIRGDLIAMSPGLPHGVHLRTSKPPRATRPRLQVPPTSMLYAPSPIRHHHSGCPILERTAG